MPPPRAPAHDEHRGLAFLLASISALGPFCIDAYLPAMGAISEAFAVPLPVAQQTLTVYLAVFALMTLWHGALSDAIGRRRVILLSIGLFGLASLGCALATSFEMLLLFRALQGMTAGAGMVVGRAIVRDLRDGAEAQRLMALVALAFAIAPAVAPVIGGWLHHGFGWRAVFLFMAAFAGATGVWSWFSLTESLPPDRRQPFRPGYLVRSYGHVLSNPRFLAMTTALASGFAGLFLYVLSAPMFLMHHLGLSETQFIWLFGPLTVGMVGGAWLSRRLAGTLTPIRTVLAATGTMAAATAINLALNLLAGPGVPWSVAPLFLYTLGMALLLPSLTLMALDLFPEQRGLAASCQSFLQSGTNAVLAAVIAPLFWATPLRLAVGSALLFSISAGATAAVALWLPGRRKAPVRRRQQEPV